MMPVSKWIPMCAAALALTPVFARDMPQPVQNPPVPVKNSGDSSSVSSADVNLPLTRVVLYSSGVGAFMHSGEINGTGNIHFQFDAEQLNDLLKSLYVAATGNVEIASINYPSQLPLQELLKGSRIDVGANTRLIDILRGLRGNEFACVMTDSSAFAGRLVSVETRQDILLQAEGERVGKEIDFANFITSEGIRTIRLSDLRSFIPTDPKILADFNKSLSVLAGFRAQTAKDIRIRANSRGENRMDVAYVIQAPVWKTSYRLMLPDDPAGKKAFLQGWAMVENPTQQEWKDVELSLVSGRPLSFVQDLYTSIYLPRPTVKRENYAGMTPMRHDVSDMSDSEAAEGMPVVEAVALDAAPLEKLRIARDFKSYGATNKKYERVATLITNQNSTKNESIGALFRYSIRRPVTLGSRESAMLELLSQEIEAERISIFNSAMSEKRAMCALMLKNTTNLLLPQGPVTIFERNAYGGDASLSDLPNGQKQILSYSLDLELSVDPVKYNTVDGKAYRLFYGAGNGMLSGTFTRVREVTYSFTNRSAHAKTVLVEHPRNERLKLVSGQTPEVTENNLRFRLDVPAGKSVSLPLRFEEVIERQFGALNVDRFPSIYLTLEKVDLAPEDRAFFQKLSAIHTKITETKTALKDLQEQIGDQENAHSRTRSSLNVLHSGDYRNKLTARLAEQDKVLDELLQKKDSLTRQLRDFQKEFAEQVIKK